MNIDDMTYGELKRIASLFSGGQKQDIEAFEIGKCYVIRTVTMYVTGKVVAVGGHEILLENAAWIADAGRYADFLKDPVSVAKEVEPYPDGCRAGVGRGSICDFCEIKETPRSQK